MTTTMKVEWLLQNLTASVDSFGLAEPAEWKRMIEEKSQDWSFPHLLRAITETGFTVPICIRQNDEPDFGEPGWEMGNGHHRLVAAILLCLDEIPVVFGDESDYMRSYVTHGDLSPSQAEVFEMWETVVNGIDLGEIE